jgi:hypothetical protein
VFTYNAKRAVRFALQLSPDVDYSVELWMLKFLNEEVEWFFDALPSLSYDSEAWMPVGLQEDYQTEREGTVTRGNLDDELYLIDRYGK